MEQPDDDRPLVLVFGLMLLTSLWAWSLSWHEPILDHHNFRQTQTAITAYWIRQDGFHLDYETPLFGPPWSIPMEFPLYQGCVAQLSLLTGLSLESSGRATSIFFLLATLPAVFLLAGLAGLSRPGRLLVVAAVLSSPTYLFYGRTFMIETTALCFSTWFLLFIGFAVRDLKLRWSVLATLFGMLAALTKITTFALYCFPAAGLALWLGRPLWKSPRPSAVGIGRGLLLSGIPVLVAVGIGAWWVRHADAVKAANPFSDFLLSSAMTAWNWGTIDQRLSATVWNEFWANLSRSVAGAPALAVLLVCAVFSGHRWRWWGVAGAASFLMGPLLFANLYYHHDYYYCANALLLLLGGGILLAAMWSAPALPRLAKIILLGLFFGSQLYSFHRGHGYHHRHASPRPPEIAAVIRAVVPAGDVVLIYGWDWNSLVPYYAERRAITVPGTREYEFEMLGQIVAKLPPRRITAMVVKREAFNAPQAFGRKRAIRFGLHPMPFATSTEGDLYLPEEMFAPAAQALAGRTFQKITLHSAQTPPPAEDELKESDLSSLDLSAFSPAPVRALSLFGVAQSSIGNRTVLNAHAPSELWFTPPAGTTRLTAEFGLDEGAYAGEQPLTDGIDVTISEIQADAPPRLLFHRSLDPVRRPVDRGIQKIELTAIGPLTGQLVFKIDPGPRESLVKDWAFWAGVDLR